MKRVRSVDGMLLEVSPDVEALLGGTVIETGKGRRDWYPEAGDELYYVGSWEGEVESADYYVLRRCDGSKWYLRCAHPRLPPSWLVILPDPLIPRWVKEAVREE